MNKITLWVVVGVLVAGVAYVAFVKKSEPVADQTPTPTPTKTAPSSSATPTKTAQVSPSPTPTATPKDETESWKTTTNSNLGFSVKYPNGWKAETTGSSSTLTNLSNSQQAMMIELNSTNANPNHLSVHEWLKTQQWPDPKPISEQFTTIATVDGVAAVEQSTTGTVYFTKGTNVFVVNNGTGLSRKVIAEKLFLQILSTFKFK